MEEDGTIAYLKAASQYLHINENNLTVRKILSKSLDMRNSEQFYYDVSVVVSIDENMDTQGSFQVYHESIKIIHISVKLV